MLRVYSVIVTGRDDEGPRLGQILRGERNAQPESDSAGDVADVVGHCRDGSYGLLGLVPTESLRVRGVSRPCGEAGGKGESHAAVGAGRSHVVCVGGDIVAVVLRSKAGRVDREVRAARTTDRS